MDVNQGDDLFYMQVRLFRLAQLKWNVDAKNAVKFSISIRYMII